MLKSLKLNYSRLGAVMVAGMVAGQAQEAEAANNFSSIATNIAGSIASLPGLISALSYLFGTLIGVLGIMKIKDHVENPTQTPLKDGAIRLAAGGALFALPIVFESMFETIGEGTTTDVAQLNAVKLGVIP